MDTPTIKKTCSACGQTKPLSAFLQLGGPEGTMYGTVCGDCRKAGLDKPDSSESDESTTKRSTESIRAEHRIHAEITKELEHKAEEEEYKKDKEKHDLQKSKKLQKTKFIASKEKKHREDFLKRHTFIDTAKITDKQKATEHKQKMEVTDKKVSVKREEKLKTIDLTGPYTPSQTGPQIKLQGTIFNQFKDWLGTGSGAYLNKNLNAPNAPGNKDKNNKKTEKSDLIEHAKKTWGPKRGG